MFQGTLKAEYGLPYLIVFTELSYLVTWNETKYVAFDLLTEWIEDLSSGGLLMDIPFGLRHEHAQKAGQAFVGLSSSCHRAWVR